MNRNLSKHHQVMSAENHRNQPDVKKIKLEEVHQTLLSSKEHFSSSKSHSFVMFSKKNSIEKFDDKHLQGFNDISKSGKMFYFTI